MSPSPGEEYSTPREAGQSVVDLVRDAFIGGLAVVVPFAVTVLVLATVVQYILNYMTALLDVTGNQGASPILIGAAVGVLIAIVFLVGFLTQFRYGETFIDYVDAALARVPGFGSIYESFREMSDVMMESDQQSFRDVKLVEFPHEGAYTLGFLTAESAGSLKDAAGERDLVTLFLPLAPNPVMGGHLVHVPSERVMDVDMTVDEGIRTVVTSGVATGGSGDASGRSSLSADELEQLAATSEVAVGAEATPDGHAGERQRRGASAAERRGAYESYAEPDSAGEEAVPSEVESYREEETLGATDAHPGDVERPRTDETLGGEHATPDAVEDDTLDGTLGEEHATPSDVAAGRNEGSLGSEFDTPADVDPAGAPSGRWRDQTRDPDAGADAEASEQADVDVDEDEAFSDVDSVERERDRSRGATRPDADADAEGR
ncbi:DUF502 domain-containing protein [Halorubellus salinus]|uniref:DUF502 domain-containing protein n=1 Tax=Halorubellus salinus TaxID=755309 RepID=UPI001D08A209|nr:DUF502 domain-containing protein [Halorubellus salinus]